MSKETPCSRLRNATQIQPCTFCAAAAAAAATTTTTTTTSVSYKGSVSITHVSDHTEDFVPIRPSLPTDRRARHATAIPAWIISATRSLQMLVVRSIFQTVSVTISFLVRRKSYNT